MNRDERRRRKEQGELSRAELQGLPNAVHQMRRKPHPFEVWMPDEDFITDINWMLTVFDLPTEEVLASVVPSADFRFEARPTRDDGEEKVSGVGRSMSSDWPDIAILTSRRTELEPHRGCYPRAVKFG